MTIQKVLVYFIKHLILNGCSFKSKGQYGNETDRVCMTQKEINEKLTYTQCTCLFFDDKKLLLGF